MWSLTKSTLLGLGLLAGGAAAAHAQSVAKLPPAGSTPPAVIQAPVYSAPQVASPNPGSNVSIPTTEHFQKPADWDTNPAYHPYSTSGMGPNPGSGVTANNEPHQPSPGSDSPARHPYSQGGTGPQPGAGSTWPTGR